MAAPPLASSQKHKTDLKNKNQRLKSSVYQEAINCMHGVLHSASLLQWYEGWVKLIRKYLNMMLSKVNLLHTVFYYDLLC